MSHVVAFLGSYLDKDIEMVFTLDLERMPGRSAVAIAAGASAMGGAVGEGMAVATAGGAAAGLATHSGVVAWAASVAGQGGAATAAANGTAALGAARASAVTLVGGAAEAFPWRVGALLSSPCCYVDYRSHS
jgi:hypothetical protein